jgi:hypothetical protein
VKGPRGVLHSRSGESKQAHFFQRRAPISLTNTLTGHLVLVKDAKQDVALNAVYQDKYLFDRTVLVVTVLAYSADVWPSLIVLMLLCEVRGHGIFHTNPFYTR